MKATTVSIVHYAHLIELLVESLRKSLKTKSRKMLKQSETINTSETDKRRKFKCEL